MKQLSVILFTLLAIPAFSQVPYAEIVGFWNAKTLLGGQELRVEITLNEDFTGTFASPDQGGNPAEMSSVSYHEGALNFEVEKFQLTFEGSVEPNGKIGGKLLQAGNSYPLMFQREKLEKKQVKRPQTPKAPFPYSSEELEISNEEDQITLSGTLLIPDNWDHNAPIMVFITGSGPQNRNEEILDHEFFLVIADHLARNGIGSFRYDDRGVGKSTGNFALATSFDFANDVHSVVNELSSRKELANHPIGLIGHSEGGMIAPMVAAENENVKLVVSLAGTGIKGKEIIRKQSKAMLIAEGLPKEMASKNSQNSMALLNFVLSNEDSLAVAQGLPLKIEELYSKEEIDQSGGIDQLFTQFNNSMNTNWFRYFSEHNPADDWSKVQCPCLILNGTKDTQVEAAANLNAIEFALRRAGNKDYEVHALPSQNHLFQECESGGLSEYGKIETTISTETLDLLLLWISKQS